MKNIRTMNIALFASGAGSNVNNIINYFKYDKTNKVKIVLSNNLNSGALTFGKKNNIDTYVFNKDELWNKNLVLDIIKQHDIDLIVLAGFLLKIPKQFIDNFKGKIINIHPSLLPKYGGKGMYGINIHNAVIKNKEKQSGITIHYVNENYDEGNIIAQHKINLLNNETPQSLLEKIKILEKQYYSQTIRNLSNEK